MNLHDSTGKQIDDATVRRYFNGAGGGTASTVSMMAHEHNLPAGAARYRLRKEIRSISDWLDEVCTSGRVLDVGCGAGAWAEIFAKRYKAVIGIEQSPLMVKAARERVACLPNVEIFEGDGRNDLPEGSFDMIFLGGLCMYLNDVDVVALLNSLKSCLVERGSIILRESTVRQGVSLAKGDYQAVYRSVSLYHQLFEDAGPFSVESRRNYAYTSMVTAEELVDLRRKWLPFLPRESTMLGSLTWWALRGTTPLSFWALPRVLSRLNISWPRLQNHFFRLRLAD
ncbi:MAG: class I SAM-dependent methyltransferase [Chloroflexi bacterium]|jgi:SAM-dependent methyltransferase|nr:class I SAM-dependent methyltransferase [Chloroflexota bacterium]